MQKKTKSTRNDTKVIENKEQKLKLQVRELKAKNRNLVRENARLKKDLQKVDEALLFTDAFSQLEIEEEDAATETVTCKRCSSTNLVCIATGVRDIYVCQECSHRETKEK